MTGTMAINIQYADGTLEKDLTDKTMKNVNMTCTGLRNFLKKMDAVTE
jgi:hypothetical protein